MSYDATDSGILPTRKPRLLLNLLILLALIVTIILCFHVLRHMPASGASFLRYGLRAGIVALALAAWFRSQAMIGGRVLKDGRIVDGLHELTAPIHRHLEARPGFANVVLIVSSAFIDMFGLFLIGVSVFGPSMRPFIALLMLFGMRQACQAVCALPSPAGMIWRNPGFPSLLVTYTTSNDFFFSGHTAIAVLGAIEIARIGPLWLGVTAAVIALIEAMTVLVLRAHYTMDIFAAGLAAWLVVWLVG